ncbi:MAG: signal peptidase II [Lachnospiraceae bacterium]|nr:signal peptidase II [Lachnospiraceae bacterium]
MKRFPYLAHILVCFVLVLFDQITKVLARTYLKTAPFALWEGVFELHYHENRGSVWGILQGKVDVLLLASVFIFALLIYVYVKMPKTKEYVPLFWVLVVMIAGAIGNTIDRVFFGFVTDFLYFKLINFPIFNVADCYLTVCAFLTVLLTFTKYKEDEFTFLSPKRKEISDAADAESDEN